METNYTHSVGQTVTLFRKKRKMKQVELAEASNLMVNTLGKLERGETDPQLSTILAAAKGLGIKPYQLFAQAEYVSLIDTPELQKIVDLLNSQDHKLLKCALSQIEALVSYKNKA